MTILEMAYTFRVLIAARCIQTDLWGESNLSWGLEEWRRVLKKRWIKIEQIDAGNPHWHVEMRKRLLQNAALSIALCSIIKKTKRIELVTNLEQYK